ncbi:MAG: hypothetical protein ACODAU_10700 [Myxococcota bacterium]
MPDDPERTEIVDEPADEGIRRDESLRVLLLGINAWAVTAFVPLLLTPAAGAAWLCAISFLLLGAGAVALPRWPTAATWTLLTSFPATLAAARAWLPEDGDGVAQGTVPLLLAAGSTTVFLLLAARVCAQPPRPRPGTARPLTERDGPRMPPSERARHRATFLAVTGTAAFALALVAPTRGSRAELEHRWRDAAPEAEVLTTVVAGVLAVAVLGLFVAPAMRRRPHPHIRRPRLAVRVALLLLLALVGVYVHRLVA